MRLALALLVANLASASEVHLSARHVQKLLREATTEALGSEFELLAIHHRGDLILRGKDVSVEVERPARLPKRGRVALRAKLRTEKEQRRLAFAAEIRAPGSEPVIRRGASILVRARSGLVLVSASGQAQEDGAVGDRIHVLCPALRKVLVGKVIDADIIEIELGGK